MVRSALWQTGSNGMMAVQKQSRRKLLARAVASSLFLTACFPPAEAAEGDTTVRPETWGAAGDGVHDDTKALQSAIDQARGRTVLLTGNAYKVSGNITGVLNIPSTGLRLRGQGAARPIISCATDGAFILQGNTVHNVEISHISFEGTDGRCVAIGVTGASSDVKISDCTTRYCGLYHGGASVGNYASVNRQNSPTRVRIENCTGTGNPKAITGLAFIALFYHADSRVSGCRASNYRHGIMWWGGDSAVNADGAPNAERKTSGIVISDCSVSNIGDGGIWGSMGRNIKIINCIADSCGDVGFDAEGCQDVIFSGGKVRNCPNGCLTTFWGARNIVFENIAVELSNANKIAFRSYNATLQATFSESVSIIGGSITCLDGVGRLDQGNGPLDSFRIQGTRLENVIIDMAQQNIHDVTIEDVMIDLTRRAPDKSGAAAISIGNLQHNGRRGGKAIIHNCRIVSPIPQPGLDDCAIAFTGGDVNADTEFLAEGNRISGFGTAFALTDYAGRARYRLRSNQIGQGKLRRNGMSSQSVLEMR